MGLRRLLCHDLLRPYGIDFYGPLSRGPFFFALSIETRAEYERAKERPFS